MKYINIIRIMMTLVISNLTICIVGQVWPDENWQVNYQKSDSFPGNNLDRSKWIKLCSNSEDSCGPINGFICWNALPGVDWDTNNVFVSNGELIIKVDTFLIKNNYGQWVTKYRTAGIHSLENEYLYGYYELNAKMIGYKDEDNQPNGTGFWPAFWLYYMEGCKTKADGECRLVHDEIDIFEATGEDYISANVNGPGWWVESPPCSLEKPGNAFKGGLPPLFMDYHKFAAEWLPDRIIFYFDDVPFFADYDNPRMPDHSSWVVIDQQIGKLYPLANTPWPLYWYTKEFTFYELKFDCESIAYIYCNSDLQSFVFKVYSDIYIGNGDYTITLATGTKKTFRAANEIILSGEFEALLGSELNLINTPCY